jgi:hypothetical protein
MSAGRVVCLLLCFFLDVHVRAEEAVAAKSARTTISRENLKIILAKGSLVEPRGEGFHLVRGQFLVETQTDTRLTTPFATVWCEAESECKALFERASDHLVIRSLEGEWRLLRNGEVQVYRVPEAMQLRLSLVADDGKAAMEFPQSLPWDSTVKAWAHLFTGKPAEFKAQVLAFRQVWKGAVETASSLHSQGAQRTIASHDQELAKEAALRDAEEREHQNLRRQMRERNFPTP